MIERVNKLINWLKGERIILSQAEFAEKIGVKASQISEMLTGKRGISERTIHKITNAFPSINPEWLLTGEGEMLKNNSQVSESDRKEKAVPFYDAEVAAGTNYDMDMSAAVYPKKMIRMGDILADSEAAIQVFGNSMTPNYPAGCVVGTKLHTDSFIEPGAVYVIETRENRYLKRLYYNEEGDYFECESDNHMLHEEGSRKGQPYYPMFKIPRNEVIRLHRVTGVIKRNII